MNRRRKRINWFRIIVLILLIAAGIYVNKVVIPTIPAPFVPTPTPTRDPESYVTEAENLFNQGKLMQSIDTYKQAIQANPNDPTIYVALARVQVFAGQYQDAQTSSEDALLLNPNNSMAHAVRAWSLDFQGDYLAAEAAIKRALDLDPNNAMAHAYYVEILVDSYINGTGPFENVAKAADESRVALNLAPNTLEAHRARGYILEATQNYEEAAREYQSAIDINNFIPDLHLQLGLNYRALGVYDKAIEEFTSANALNPSDPQPDYLISRTYATVGEYAKAVQYAETAVGDNPSDPNLHGNLGVMYYHDVKWTEAAKELELAVRGGTTGDNQTVQPVPLTTDTHVAEYYFTYALALARLNRCGEALQVAQSILSNIPSDDIAVTNANETIKLCQQNLSVTPTAALQVPAGSETPVATTTPAP
jgi:tetratricopeptide (TPR) repeat protein